MRILSACEESQAVTIEFRERGFEAYSCDILPCSGGHPEWHFQRDIFEIINGGLSFTQDGKPKLIKGWDCMIAFPPCTHLAVSGARHFEQKRKDGRQQQGVDFFMKCVDAVEKIGSGAIENPIGIMSGLYRKPDQIVHPFYWGDPYQKSTCLWLINLPLLFHAKDKDLFNDKITHTDRGEFYITPSGKKMPAWMCDPVGKDGKKLGYNTSEIKSLRSKFFPGVAKAMAEQWGNYLNETKC